MDTQPRWRLAGGSIAWRQFDGEAVVYDDSTGNTHHLGLLGSAVLRALAAHPAGIGVNALALEIHADGAIAVDDALVIEMERTLRELRRLELAAYEGV
jgi:ABC-type taurine transport system substrate-binding protein